MASVKIGTKLKGGTIVAICTDGVMFDHPSNGEPIKISFSAIESMAHSDTQKAVKK